MMENDHLQISPAEMKVIANIVSKDAKAIDAAYAEGLHIAGVRYVLTRVDEGEAYARAVGSRNADFTSQTMDDWTAC